MEEEFESKLDYLDFYKRRREAASSGSKFQQKRKPNTSFTSDKSNGGPPPQKKIKPTPCEKLTNGKSNGTNGVLATKEVRNEGPKEDIFEERKKLKIFKHRNKIIRYMKKFDTILLKAQTGSGKTTQIPQFILWAKLNADKCIAVTQPRRVAAISLANRVALEYDNDKKLGESVGETIGYSVRFEDKTSERTKIKYMTDGMLLREAMFDKYLMNYSCVVLDEAHERTIHTDIVMGIVKNAQLRRREQNLAPLKVIIMSAAFDLEVYEDFFNEAYISEIGKKPLSLRVKGYTYPINLYYLTEPERDYPVACFAMFMQIHMGKPTDFDVLMFLTGQEEIELVANRIKAEVRRISAPPVVVHTLYAAQNSQQQMQIFEPAPPGHRKLIISTNIAETSITIPGIRCVVDSGMVKVRTYHPDTGLEVLKVQRISQEQALQRRGRAGRDSEGYCYRTYTEEEFNNLRAHTEPEIQRANLTSAFLPLLAQGFHPKKFDFLSRPSEEAINTALEELHLLGAIEDVESAKLTKLGKLMSKFPLHPKYTKIILAAEKFGCVAEAITAVSFLSTESVFLNPPSAKEAAHEAHSKFFALEGDIVTSIKVYREFVKQKNNKSDWCFRNFIDFRTMNYVKKVREQLKTICNQCKIEIKSCSGETSLIRKSMLAGLFMNVAEYKREDRHYVTVHKKQNTWIHPSSVMGRCSIDIVLYTEMVQTSKCYIRGVNAIEREWLLQVAPDYFKRKHIRTHTRAGESVLWW